MGKQLGTVYPLDRRARGYDGESTASEGEEVSALVEGAPPGEGGHPLALLQESLERGILISNSAPGEGAAEFFCLVTPVGDGEREGLEMFSAVPL